MSYESYNVLINGLIIAEGMSLGHALIFVKALFFEYPNDPSISMIAIEREKLDETHFDVHTDSFSFDDVVHFVREDAEARRDGESEQI